MSVTPEQARSIAKDAYIFGVPMVSIYATIYAFSVDTKGPQYKGPFNSILNIARVFTPDDTAFVTPNSDTPYSFAGLDVRMEPAVITIPKIEKDRYFVFQLVDLYTFNFAYIGSRSTGNDGGTYLIAGPGWDGAVPPGITKVIRSETAFVNVVGRTQLFGPDDLENVKKIQAGYKVQPLSVFLGKPAHPTPHLDWVMPIAPIALTKSLDFFNVFAFTLQFAMPPHPSEVELRKRFAEIGIGPGLPFDQSSLSPDIKTALLLGMADGQKEIEARRAELGGNSQDLFGTREFLKNDYVRRAAGTEVGIGANSKEEALYPILEKDSDGQPVDASKSDYTLHFGTFPPVHAFWSVTMYALPSQLLVKNPVNRYLINAPMLPQLERDADGGLTLHIQNKTPGAGKEANWLPAPAGPFMVALRYYWPKAELLDGSWPSPKLERVK
jgi:hypothetical protein